MSLKRVFRGGTRPEQDHWDFGKFRSWFNSWGLLVCVFSSAMDKENIRPLMDGNDIIEYIGVSKRLGNNVLQELEQRASNILPRVSPGKQQLLDEVNGVVQGSHGQIKTSISMKFHDKHEKRFQDMESIDTHYSLAKYVDGSEKVCQTQNQYQSGDVAMEEPQTPAKRSEAQISSEDDGSVQKKQKSVSRDSHGGASSVGDGAALFSPVTDITHRIRRLRVRMSSGSERDRHERDRRRNIISNTPLRRQQQIHESVPMPPSSLPTFAKPTATSLQRKQQNDPFQRLLAASKSNSRHAAAAAAKQASKHGDIFRNLNKKDTATTTSSSAGPAATTSRAPSRTTSRTTSRATSRTTTPEKQPHNRIPKSKSVFERLYEQSTISRSNSAQDVSLKPVRKPNTRLPSSKTQNDLHSVTTTAAKLTKSTTMHNLSVNRPQWR